MYQFNVIAEDEPDSPGSLFGYAYVKVRPKDINDNSPVFDSKELLGSVAEHSPAGMSQSLSSIYSEIEIKCIKGQKMAPLGIGLSFHIL